MQNGTTPHLFMRSSTVNNLLNEFHPHCPDVIVPTGRKCLQQEKRGYDWQGVYTERVDEGCEQGTPRENVGVAKSVHENLIDQTVKGLPTTMGVMRGGVEQGREG